jgi:hypothetical protein
MTTTYLGSLDHVTALASEWKVTFGMKTCRDIAID